VAAATRLAKPECEATINLLFPLPLRERARVRGKHKFAGGRPAAGYFLLRDQEKVTKEKAAPLRRSFGRLRTSFGLLASWAAVQLARSASRPRAQTVLAGIPQLACQTSAAQKGT